MDTGTARQMARDRHNYMLAFFRRLDEEALGALAIFLYLPQSGRYIRRPGMVYGDDAGLFRPSDL
jgi:hypothetical protein